jgi:hypothetical protein
MPCKKAQAPIHAIIYANKENFVTSMQLILIFST